MTAPDWERRHAEAACAVWLNGPSWEQTPTATIGRFSCTTADAGAALLAEVIEDLRRQGRAAVLGPMDGDTWHSYRLVVDAGNRPPFFLEPHNPPHAVEAFLRAGFLPVAHYASAIAGATGLRSGLKGSADIRLRPFDPGAAERDLGLIFRLSSQGFRANAFATPIDESDFLALYQPILPHVVPDLVLLAEDAGGQPLGFVFGLPDFAEGATPRTVIFKTYAALRPGVGTILADAFHKAARRLGFEQVIHALMHADNLSLRYSALTGATIFRRYELFGRRLTP